MAFKTKQEAYDYLAERGLATKAYADYSTDYVKRIANKFQQQEQAGKELSRAAARGHARAEIEHLSQTSKRLDQYIMRTPFDRDLDADDLRNLARRTRNKKGWVMIIIQGVVNYKPRRGSVPTNNIQSLSFWLEKSDLNAFLKKYNGDIYDFVEFVSGLEWEEVLSVSLAFEDDMKQEEHKHA